MQEVELPSNGPNGSRELFSSKRKHSILSREGSSSAIIFTALVNLPNITLLSRFVKDKNMKAIGRKRTCQLRRGPKLIEKWLCLQILNRTVVDSD